MGKLQKATDCEFKISCNYYEIYKEKLYDLLSEKTIAEQKANPKDAPQL